LANGQVTVNDQLNNFDAFDRVRIGSRCKTYSLPLTAGKQYQIDMTSNQIDSYLRLDNGANVEMAHDDDSGGFPHARIIFICPTPGTYIISCTPFAQGATGNFTLTVRER